MRRAFTGRQQTIVARRTGQRRDTMVHDRSHVEALRHMAGCAIFDGRDVINVFAACGFVVVASGTQLGYAFEFTVAMTGFT